METDKGDAPDLITSLRDQISNLGSKLEASEKDNAELREALEKSRKHLLDNHGECPIWINQALALTGSKPIQGEKLDG